MTTLSHVVGTLLPQSPPRTVGPDSGAANPPGGTTWTTEVTYSVQDTKFLTLHFVNAKLPGDNRIEVFLGYGTDVFKAVDGSDFWTRPINVQALAGAPVVVKYITTNSNSGSVQLATIGVGERAAGDPGHNSFSNCDPFFTTAAYLEPKYDDFWYCTLPPGKEPNWENSACVTDPGDVRARVSRSVGMIILADLTAMHLSTCSVTLVDADQVLTAGHCHDNNAEALSGSVTFDYQTDCLGKRLPGYNPTFFKVMRVIKRDKIFTADMFGDARPTVDFSRLKLATSPPGIPPIQMRPDIPQIGEEIFGIHHPNGAVKKLSVPQSEGFARVLTSSETQIEIPKNLQVTGTSSNFHVSGGSSGSGLFDMAGRIVGVLSIGNPCQITTSFLRYFPTATILKINTPSLPMPITRDVMVVFDHSGSMVELDTTGRTKIEVARDAVSLFVQLVRSDVGNRVGLVSFSTTASSPLDFPIANLDASAKLTLIGLPPYASGKVGGLVPNGATSIGEGLDAARLQFPVQGVNPRTILLMTDGMENTPRFISNVEGMLGDINIHVIGLGTAANLDGPLLSKFAANHHGQYNHAGSGVELQKFFSNAFGNIFETGLLSDPEHDLSAHQNASEPISFQVCGEDGVTVAVGWDTVKGSVLIRLTTPGGAAITGRSPDTEESAGRTWTFLRVPLPHNGERDGTWNATVFRPSNSTFAPLHYFINVIPTGGPQLFRAPDNRAYYTGDSINPLTYLRYLDGSSPSDTKIQLTLSRPNASIGSILSQHTLGAPVTIAGDTIPARQATLAEIEQEFGSITTPVDETFELSDHVNGTFEDAGIFGSQLLDKLVTEGTYTFHARATYEQGSCTSTRELFWSLHVDVGIDPSHTDTTITLTGNAPNGQRTGSVTVVPGDRYGNQLGPGRSDGVTITGSTGTTITGGVHDNGDGSYTVPIVWDPASLNPPGIVIGQPGRPPIVVQPPSNMTENCTKGPHHGWPDKGGPHHGWPDKDEPHYDDWPGKDKDGGHKPHEGEHNLNVAAVSGATPQSSNGTYLAVIIALSVILGCVVLLGVIVFVRIRRRARPTSSLSSMSEPQDRQPLIVDKAVGSTPSRNLEH